MFDLLTTQLSETADRQVWPGPQQCSGGAALPRPPGATSQGVPYRPG